MYGVGAVGGGGEQLSRQETRKTNPGVKSFKNVFSEKTIRSKIT
jgi:hypothetical protein